MKMRLAAALLSMMLTTVPASAADYITYQAYSAGTVTFFNNLSPDPPLIKSTGYTFTFIAPAYSSFSGRAEISGSSLGFFIDGQFNILQAVACLAESPNGNFPTSDPALVSGCGSVFHYVGKNSGYQYYGNFYDLKAVASDGIPPSTGFVTSSFFDLPPSAVPEPATWATMLLGFGLIGGAIRVGRRPRVVVRRV